MVQSSQMQALQFAAPATDTSMTSVGPLPVPRPGPGELAIDVHFAGINFKDVMSRRGDAGYAPHWPFVPGLEVAGTVRAVGPGVDAALVGRRVLALTNSGGLAEVVLTRSILAVEVPDGVELAAAAAVPGALTTAVLLLDLAARVRTGDTVLVHSASGAVGHAVAQYARVRGVGALVGAVGAVTRIAGARTAGYDEVIVRSNTLAEDVRRRTTGRGVDVVLDPQGTEFLDADLASLAPGGRIVLFGNAGGAELTPLPDASRLYASNAAVVGFSLAALSVTAPATVASAMCTALDHLAHGDLSVNPILVRGLAAAATAQQALADGTGAGKYVVQIRLPDEPASVVS